MHDTTFLDFATAVSCYLGEEWPAAAVAINTSAFANRAAVRATLDSFMHGHTIPRAAGDVAFAIATATPGE